MEMKEGGVVEFLLDGSGPEVWEKAEVLCIDQGVDVSTLIDDFDCDELEDYPLEFVVLRELKDGNVFVVVHREGANDWRMLAWPVLIEIREAK